MDAPGESVQDALAWTRPIPATRVCTVSATDPLAMAAAGGLLMLLATVAAWLPARRAGRIEPAAVLRQL